jgi:hypothetical protein
MAGWPGGWQAARMSNHPCREQSRQSAFGR